MKTSKSSERKVTAFRSYGNRPVDYKRPGGPRSKPKTRYI